MGFFKYMARFWGIYMSELIIAYVLLNPTGAEMLLLAVGCGVSSTLIAIGTEHDDD